MIRVVPLEPAAEAVCIQSAIPPLIFRLPPEQGRKRLEEMQSSPVYKYPADISVIRFPEGSPEAIPVYLIAPQEVNRISDVIFYIHGAGWVFGSFHTHEKLVRELAAKTGALVVFPEYSRAPEARYPTAIEQCFSLLTSLWELLDSRYPGINHDTLTVAGDSAGGNMAIAMQLMAAMGGGPYIQKLLLYYPVTDSCFCTPSYRQFAVGYYLYRAGMQWFWQQYAPAPADRLQITASPLQADFHWFKQFPPTMIINGQADVLRSEGEAFGEKLRRAGTEVTALRIQGIIHDFVMLNALDQTQACRLAMDASIQWILRKNQDTNSDAYAVSRSSQSFI